MREFINTEISGNYPAKPRKSAILAGILTVTLLACSPKVVTRDVPVVVSRPVPQPCVTGWPQKPPPLPLEGHWAGFDVRQKAAALGAYAINMTNYAEALRAATAACPEIR